MTRSDLTLPNALSVSRILLMPVLVLLAARGEAYWYLGLLALALATDLLDGFLARLLNQTSELGVKLDSWGDLLIYFTMMVGLLLLWPRLFVSEIWFLAMGVGFYFLPMLASLYKFRTLPRFHTWAAKIAALLMAPGYFAMCLWGDVWLFRLAILFHVWVSVEELLIIYILKRNRYDVPTFVHARRLTSRARQRLRQERERMQERRDLRQERRRQRRADRERR